MTQPDWATIAAKLPVGSDPQSLKDLEALFDHCDYQGHFYLSKEDVEAGLKSFLKLGPSFDLKNVASNAFNTAKASNKGNAGLGSNFIQRTEFRIVTIYFRLFLELYQMLSVTESVANGKLDKEAFSKAAEKIGAFWNLRFNSLTEEFARIPKKNGYLISFNDFCDWAVRKRLEREPLVEVPASAH